MTNNKKVMRTFFKLCTKAYPDLIEQFEDLFFTLEEKAILVSRLSIIKELLDRKLSQREISKKLKTSISKITRGSNALKSANKKLISLLKEELYE